MTLQLPQYLSVPGDRLGEGHQVGVEMVPGSEDVAQHMAKAMLQVVQQAQARGRSATLIVPVGPVEQFPLLAQLINDQRMDCRDLVVINMDEYLTDDDQWIDTEHPLSFRAYMDRAFYDLLDSSLAPRPENRVFPHPDRCAEIQQLIQRRGGVDACFGGIGINGHMAFNEPPELGEPASVDGFANLPTRPLSLSRETRTINSVTVGGEISIVPRCAVTVGMREILQSRQVRFYCNRPWQRAVVRRVLHGPITASCPASLLRLHEDAQLTITDFVAALPEIRLR